MNPSLLAAEKSGVGIDTTQAPSVQRAPRKQPQRASCGTCLHFLPGQPLPGQSLGRCTLTLAGLPPAPVRGYAACYPLAPRQCPNFEGIES